MNLSLSSSLYAIFPIHSVTLNSPTNLVLSFLVPANGEYSKTVALLLLPYFPTAYDAHQNSASGSPVLSSSGLWRPGLLVGYSERSELHQASYSGFPQ